MHYFVNKKLREHLASEHQKSPLSAYLREIVYGGIDGIVTTFAVVAGFSGASIDGNSALGLTFAAVLLFGFANLFGDAFSMGLGNFLSIRTEKDIYKRHKAKERHEISDNEDMEEEETVYILLEKGFSKKDAQHLVSIYKKNPNYWVDWMMNHELQMPNPERVNPYRTAISTFLAFIAFGTIPILPYIFSFGTSLSVFVHSIIATFVALFLLGYLKGKVIGGGRLRSLFEVIFLGSISAVVAFIVGTFF